jgi:dihydroorotase
MSKSILYNASIFTQEVILKGFIVINNGKIAQITKGTPDAQVINLILEENRLDCKDYLVLPGFIDTHVHFRDTGQSHKETLETGSKCAISGGVTTVLTMPNTNPPLSTLSNIQNYLHLGEKQEKLYCNIGLIAGVNDGFSCEELPNWKKNPIFGIKIYPGSTSQALPLEWSANWQNDDNPDAFYNTLEQKIQTLKQKDIQNWDLLCKSAQKSGLPILFHPELPLTSDILNEKFEQTLQQAIIANHPNPHLKAHSESHSIVGNERALVEMVIIYIMKLFPDPLQACHVHFCHVSSVEIVELIEKTLIAKGYPASIEISPHHMLLHNQLPFEQEAFGKVLCPLRDPEQQIKMLKLCQEGRMTTIGTDHAPHTKEEKSQSFILAPSGFPGVDKAAILLLTRVFKFHLALVKLVTAYSTKPAELFGLTNKGKLEIGYDADLIVVKKVEPYLLDPSNSFGKCKWSPYKNQEVTALIDKVFLKGHLVFDPTNDIIEAKGNFVSL